MEVKVVTQPYLVVMHQMAVLAKCAICGSAMQAYMVESDLNSVMVTVAPCDKGCTIQKSILPPDNHKVGGN